eukprot:scaffold293317_cov56-Attheya_sp.AAC.1
MFLCILTVQLSESYIISRDPNDGEWYSSLFTLPPCILYWLFALASHTAVRGNQNPLHFKLPRMSSLERLSAMQRCDWFKKGESDDM